MDIEFDSIQIGLENCDSYEIPRELVNGFYIDGIEDGIWAHESGHAEKGFIGSVRQAQAFIWHKENGLLAILNSNVIPENTGCDA